VAIKIPRKQLLMIYNSARGWSACAEVKTGPGAELKKCQSWSPARNSLVSFALLKPKTEATLQTGPSTSNEL
jgi:hypothetical protein